MNPFCLSIRSGASFLRSLPSLHPQITLLEWRTFFWRPFAGSASSSTLSICMIWRKQNKTSAWQLRSICLWLREGPLLPHSTPRFSQLSQPVRAPSHCLHLCFLFASPVSSELVSVFKIPPVISSSSDHCYIVMLSLCVFLSRCNSIKCVSKISDIIHQTQILENVQKEGLNKENFVRLLFSILIYQGFYVK